MLQKITKLSLTSRKNLTNPQKAVDKVKRQTDKEALQNKLTEVKKVVDANEKSKKKPKKRKAEAKKKAEAEASENGGTVVETKEGEYEVVSESNGEGNTGSQKSIASWQQLFWRTFS